MPIELWRFYQASDPDVWEEEKRLSYLIIIIVVPLSCAGASLDQPKSPFLEALAIRDYSPIQRKKTSTGTRTSSSAVDDQGSCPVIGGIISITGGQGDNAYAFSSFQAGQVSKRTITPATYSNCGQITQ